MCADRVLETTQHGEPVKAFIALLKQRMALSVRPRARFCWLTKYMYLCTFKLPPAAQKCRPSRIGDVLII